MPANRPLKGALIGCGFVSRHHLDAWAGIPEASLVAFCEVDPLRLENAGARVPDARLYRDSASLFAAERLDFVEICTGPSSHPALVTLAAEHGAHVLCQKPSANTRAELLAMIEACEAHAVRLMIHENWRFRGWNRAIRGEIEAGVIGRPVRLRINHADTRALRPGGLDDQPFLASQPRMILMEMGCHLVDTARFLLGEVASVSATLARFGPGHPGEDLATLSLRFCSGALGLLDMTWCATPAVARPEWALNETVVEGTEATLRLLRTGSLQLERLDGQRETRPVPLPPDDQVYLEGYLKAQSHFIAHLLDDRPLESSGRDNLRTMDVIWAAYRSAEAGRTVNLTV